MGISPFLDVTHRCLYQSFIGQRMNWLTKLFPEWMHLTRRQIDLLWMDRAELTALKASLGKPTAAIAGANGNGGARDPKTDIAIQEIEWAERVMIIAEQAAAASERKDYTAAIRLYRKALQQAPDCDLYLMSIGACYANMGQPARGLPYLKRAAKINPNNDRIQHNLAVVRHMLSK
jgi:tetratricopeptide (TPR) repeat protein